MNAMRSYTLISAALLFVLAACSANSQSQDANVPMDPTTPLKIAILHSSTQCGPAVATQWISNQQQFESSFRATQQQMLSSSAPQPPTMDFSRYGILLISMGQQRTGGYAIELAQEELGVNGDTAEVRVRWREPEAGMMVIQVLTHPCVFLQVPRGDYASLRVVDQSNNVRAELAVD